MPPHRLRRTPAGRVAPLLRWLVALLATALLATGCGGEKPAGGSDERSPAGTGSEAEPAQDEPAPDPGFQAPKVGECHRMTPAQSRASVTTSPRVNCRANHNTVVAFVGYVPRAVTATTPLAQRRALGRRFCEPAYRRVAGGTLADRATSILTWTLFTPSQAQLQRGARWLRCDVVARSGNQLIPLPPAQPLLKQGVPEQLRVCQNEAGLDLSCARPHAYRVEAVYLASGSAYPDATAYTPVARARCKQLTGRFGGFWQPPSKAGWQAGDRFVRCLAPTLPATP
jgi:hypothetical protein